jgi:hypothetical protein
MAGACVRILRWCRLGRPYNKLEAKHEKAYWAHHSSVNRRVIYASSISLIEVLDILVNSRRNMSWRVPHFPLHQAARAHPRRRLSMTSDGYSLHSLSIGTVAGLHQL